MKARTLYYAVNVDFDCLIDEGKTLKEALGWFSTQEAEESYEKEWWRAIVVANRVYRERTKKERLAELDTLQEELQKEWQSGSMSDEHYEFEMYGIQLSKDVVSKL